jgi:hypothetical protein
LNTKEYLHTSNVLHTFTIIFIILILTTPTPGTLQSANKNTPSGGVLSQGGVFIGENFGRRELSGENFRVRIIGGESSGENLQGRIFRGESSGENLRQRVFGEESSRENFRGRIFVGENVRRFA